MLVTENIVAVWVVINLIAFGLIWHDKRSAINRSWRVPEFSFFLLAVLGASATILLAMHWMRHKTAKSPFKTRILVIMWFWTFALGAAAHAVFTAHS